MPLQLLKIIILTSVLAGCANLSVDENRAGCTFIDGTARSGTLTQFAKGKAKGVYIYMGDKIPSGITITCNANKQGLEITTVNETNSDPDTGL